MCSDPLSEHGRAGSEAELAGHSGPSRAQRRLEQTCPGVVEAVVRDTLN